MAADSAFHQVFERAELGAYDLGMPGALVRFRPAERDLIEALYGLGRLDEVAADAALRRYATRDDRDIERRREFYSLREDLSMLQGQYAAAAEAGMGLLQLPGAEQQPGYQGAVQTLGVAQMLSAVPPVRVPGGVVAGMLAATRDAAGLTRVTIRVNGQPQEAVVDTGASFSVVSATTARNLGLMPLRGEAKLGSSVSAEISTQLAVAGNVEVGGTRFESVVLLVLDDAQLTFPVPGGYAIPAILGFPELQRLGHWAFDAAAMHIGDGPPTHGRRNLFLNGSKLYVETDVAGSCVPLHLDTGASASELTGFYTSQHPLQVKTLQNHTRHLGGAGGVTQDEVLNWPGALLKVGDRQIMLSQLDVSQSKSMVPPLRFGTLGRDVLSRGYGIDFLHGQLWIKGDAPALGNACQRRVSRAGQAVMPFSRSAPQ